MSQVPYRLPPSRPGSKIGLSYVDVVCVYGGRGGLGVEVLILSEGVRIVSTCFVSVWGSGVRSSTSSSVKI